MICTVCTKEKNDELPEVSVDSGRTVQWTGGVVEVCCGEEVQHVVTVAEREAEVTHYLLY